MVQNTNKQNKRTFAEIAREIKQVWKNVYFGAEPYLQAMLTIDSSDKNARYLMESAETIVTYFLANATYWRGDDARRIRAELKSMIK